MPDTNTKFSRGMPSVGITFCTVARIAKSPQPGHHRTIWSDLKSLAVCIGPEAGSVSSSSFRSERRHHLLHGREDREVAAARAPPDHLVRLEVLGRLHRAGSRERLELVFPI